MQTMTPRRGEVRVVDGNRAACLAVARCRPDVIAIFPITPQSPMIEDLAGYVARGELDAEIVEVEGENSAIGALIGASALGARTFTATSSNGLAFMWDGHSFASGHRLPIVMIDCTREMPGTSGVSSGQQDVMCFKDTGWIQIHVESCQEIHDAVIQAYRLAEDPDILVPVMVIVDGFYLSHLTQRVEVARQEDVDDYLAPLKQSNRPIVTPENPLVFGVQTAGRPLVEYRQRHGAAMDRAKARIDEIDREFGQFFGRSYGGQIEAYGCDDAEIALVTTGSAAGTVKSVIKRLRAEGTRVGLVKVRAFRPFPEERLREVLADKKAIGVIDRSVLVGWNCGHLYMELRAALSDLPRPIPILDFIDGLGGIDISKQNIEREIALTRQAAAGLPVQRVTWMALEQD